MRVSNKFCKAGTRLAAEDLVVCPMLTGSVEHLLEEANSMDEPVFVEGEDWAIEDDRMVEDLQEEEGGILIVEAEEHEIEPPTPPQNNSGQTWDRDSIHLSLPHSDSIPSDIVSLDNDDHHNPSSFGEVPPLENEAAQPRGFEAISREMRNVLRGPMGTIVVVALVVFSLLVGNVYQLRRYSTVSSELLQIQQENQRLKLEIEKQTRRKELPPPSSCFPLGGDGEECTGETTTTKWLDNCFGTLETRIQMGSCMNEYVESVQSGFRQFRNGLMQTTESLRQTTEFVREKMNGAVNDIMKPANEDATKSELSNVLGKITAVAGPVLVSGIVASLAHALTEEVPISELMQRSRNDDAN